MKCPRPFLLLSLVLFLFQGCALFRPLPERPLNGQQVDAALSRIREQGASVASFYAVGNLSVKNWIWEREANLFTAGTRSPLGVKIEITHAWGQPILHVLLDRSRFRVLSFPERTLYLGDFDPKALSRFLPVDCDLDLLWAALRAYPILLEHERVSSRRTNQISLFDKQGVAIEIIELTEGLQPGSVIFPEKHLEFEFADFESREGIVYARKVEVKDLKGKRSLKLELSKMVFNRPIPQEILALEKPPAFETVRIEKD
jgi:hypothetical protein